MEVRGFNGLMWFHSRFTCNEYSKFVVHSKNSNVRKKVSVSGDRDSPPIRFSLPIKFDRNEKEICQASGECETRGNR